MFSQFFSKSFGPRVLRTLHKNADSSKAKRTARDLRFFQLIGHFSSDAGGIWKSHWKRMFVAMGQCRHPWIDCTIDDHAKWSFFPPQASNMHIFHPVITEQYPPTYSRGKLKHDDNSICADKCQLFCQGSSKLHELSMKQIDIPEMKMKRYFTCSVLKKMWKKRPTYFWPISWKVDSWYDAIFFAYSIPVDRQAVVTANKNVVSWDPSIFCLKGQQERRGKVFVSTSNHSCVPILQGDYWNIPHPVPFYTGYSLRGWFASTRQHKT